MAFAGTCPYLKDSRNAESTICECARFTFPDKKSRRDVLYKYCGHPTGWQQCTFKAVLDDYYGRLYSSDEKRSERNMARGGTQHPIRKAGGGR